MANNSIGQFISALRKANGITQQVFKFADTIPSLHVMLKPVSHILVESNR